jgi:glycosyltransferase involved in cell wall biosynthesis
LKLVIQIPCYNESENLAETIAGLPRQIRGVDCVEVLVIDDGSTDDTARVASEHGASHVVRLSRNQGLAAAFMVGIDTALKLGADIIVNTDADHQYPGDELPKLVEPIVNGRADLVIGDRQTDTLKHFSFTKRLLQRWGSRLVRQLSNTVVTDSPSGFRAMSRQCALRLFVHNRFTYTLETVILAGQLGLSIENVPIRINPTERPSRLFRSTHEYLRRAGSVILRAYAMYRPLQLVGLFAITLFFFGVVLGGRFLYYYVKNPSYSGYTQSLVVGTGAVIIAFLLLATALLSELLASNRRLLEEILLRVRRLELDEKRASSTDETTLDNRRQNP